MARLFVAQQIARPANVEVVAGKLKACTKAVEIAQNLQPLLGHLGQLRVLFVGEVGIGAQFRAAHATTQLVKLSKAEDVGAVDDDGVGARQVEPRFDDRRREQDVVLALVERTHPLFDFAGAHLSVRGDGLHLGHVFAQPGLDLFHVGNARHDDEALPAAVVFAHQGLTHDHVVPFHHVGPYRQAVDRRGLDGGQFAQARHRHLQGARDGRGSQCEHMDIGAQLLELFLVRHAEPLFLVHDYEPKVLEIGRFGQDGMRADNDVHIARSQLLARLLRFLARHKPRQATDIQGEAGKALFEVLVMLAGQQGGRRDHRDLLPVHRGDEGCAQGHLGLAETDIAAHEPVHRPPAFKVTQHVGDGAVLIVGFLPRKAIEELIVRSLLDLEHRRFLERAGGCRLHQFAGNGADAFLELRTAFLPSLAAEPVELHRLFGRAVARQNVDILDRDKQLVPAAIFQLNAIVLRLAHGDGFEPEILADAVFGVDDQIADAERLQLRHEGIGIAPLALAPYQPVAENVLLGQQFEIVIREARPQRQDHRRRRALCRQPESVLPAFGEFDFDACVFQDRSNARAAALGIGREQRAALVLPDRLQMLGEHRIDIVAPRAFRREIATRTKAEGHDLVAFRLVERGCAVRRRMVEGPRELVRL